MVFWLGDITFAMIPVAFLVGLLRTRMHRSRVAGLVVELGSASQPGEVRDAIARALGDPSLDARLLAPATRDATSTLTDAGSPSPRSPAVR